VLFDKLFSSFKIDGAMHFLSKQAAREGLVFFTSQKIPFCLINIPFIISDEVNV